MYNSVIMQMRSSTLCYMCHFCSLHVYMYMYSLLFILQALLFSSRLSRMNSRLELLQWHSISSRLGDSERPFTLESGERDRECGCSTGTTGSMSNSSPLEETICLYCVSSYSSWNSSACRGVLSCVCGMYCVGTCTCI